MIIITQAGGFLGSNLLTKLNEGGYSDVVLVDDFKNYKRGRNVEGKLFYKLLKESDLPDFITEKQLHIQFIFHFIENEAGLQQLDLTKDLFNLCVQYGLPFIYSFSEVNRELEAAFETWAGSQYRKPYFYVGLKCKNVYGPGQVTEEGKPVVLYKLYQEKDKNKTKVEDLRQNFIYVKDVVEVLYFLMHNRKYSGIYTVAFGEEHALQSIGYTKPFYSLEDGIKDYAENHLEPEDDFFL